MIPNSKTFWYATKNIISEEELRQRREKNLDLKDDLLADKDMGKEMYVPFVDLKNQTASIRHELDAAIQDVIDRSTFILGPQVEAFEASFATWCGSQFCVGVGNGTDAISCALLACSIMPGDEVILPANSYIATFEAVLHAGGVPVLVDCGKDALIDPFQIERVISHRTRFVIAVHLYGQVCDMDRIVEITKRHNLTLIEDCAQAHGATYRGKKAGSFGRAAAFSFYPSKNLGAFGDAGAILTDDPEVYQRLKMHQNHGELSKNVHDIVGTNSRLDSLQAAILSVKLPYLQRWNEQRRAHAEAYRNGLKHLPCNLPVTHPERSHIYHLFVIATKRRDDLKAFLQSHDIGTGIHYPTPIHLQPANRNLGLPEGSFPVAESLSQSILSLPMFPELTHEQIHFVIETTKQWFHRI